VEEVGGGVVKASLSLSLRCRGVFFSSLTSAARLPVLNAGPAGGGTFLKEEVERKTNYVGKDEVASKSVHRRPH